MDEIGNSNFSFSIDNGDVLKKNKDTAQSFEDLGNKAEVVGNKIDKIFESESPNEMKQIIDIQKKAIIDLEQQYKKSAAAIASAERELTNMQPSQEKGLLNENLQKQKQSLAELRVEIDGEKEALAQMNNELQNSGGKSTTLRTQIRNLKAQMATMTEGTQEYTMTMQQLGRMVDRMGDITQQGKAFADDEKYIKATTAAIQGLTGVVTAGTGVMSLFGVSQENVAMIQAKLQAVMAISIGIEQVAIQLNKDSYVMHILLPKAKALDAAATSYLSGAMTALGISTGVATVAARAFLITITGGLILAIPLLIGWFDKLSKQHEENKKRTEASAKAHAELAKSIGDSAAKQIVAITELQMKYSQLDKTQQEKTKFLKDNKKAFEELGVSIKTVGEMENLLIKQADAYVQSVVKRSMADASRSEAMKAFSQAIQLRNKELVEGVDYKVQTKIVASGTPTSQGTIAGTAGISYNSVRDEAQIAKNKEAARRDYDEQAKWYEERGKKMVTDAVSFTNQADKILKDATITPFKKEEKEKDKKDYKDDIQKYGQEIADLWNKVSEDIATSKANAIKNEFDKTLALNEVNMKKELSELDKQIATIKQKEIEKAKAKFLDAGGKEKDFVAPVIKLTPEEQSKYEEAQRQIIEKTYRLNDEAYKKLIDGFETYQEKRNKIQEDAENKRKQFTEEGLLNNIPEVDQEEEEALKKLDEEFANKQDVYIAFAKSIANKKEEELKQIFKSLKDDLLTGNYTDEQKAVLQLMVDKTQDAIDNLDKNKKKDNKADSTIKSLNEITTSINNAISGFDNLDERTKKTLTLCTKTAGGIINIISGVQSLEATGEKALSGIEKASVVITIISSAISIISSFWEDESEAQQQALDKQIEQIKNQNELNAQIRETVNLWAEANNAIFGKDEYESMVRWASLINDRYTSLINSAQSFYDTTFNSSAFESGLGSIDNIYNEIRDKINNDINSALNINLGEVTGVNIDKLRELLIIYQNAGNDLMVAKLQNVIDEWDAYQDAIEKTESAIADFVGQVRTDFMKAMDDMWKSGIDSAAAYENVINKTIDSISSSLENMIESQAYNLFFSKLFDDLKNKLKDLADDGLSPEALTTAYADAFNNFATSLDTAIPLANDWVDMMTQTLADKGYNLFENNTSRTATTGGFAAASQDSIDELNGSFAAIQSHTYSIKDNTDTLKANSGLILQELRGIKQDTSRLGAIEYAINDIKDHGVIIRA